MLDLQSKIEKEFDDNPLLKNMGITVYGSVYESKQKAQQSTVQQPAHSNHRIMVWANVASGSFLLLDGIYINGAYIKLCIHKPHPLCRTN